MRHAVLVLAIFVLFTAMLLAIAGETKAADRDTLVVAPLEPATRHIIAFPGIPVTLSCNLYNPTPQPLTVTPMLKLPAGWVVFAPQAALTVKAGQSQILMIPIQIAPDAAKGLYRISLVFTGPGLAEPVAAEYFIEVLGGASGALRVEPLALRYEAAPGEPVTLACKLYNTGERPLLVTPELEPPAGWRALVPPAALTIGPGEEQILLFPILVPEDARAGETMIHLALAGEGLGESVTAGFLLQVLAVKGLDLRLQKAPSYVVAEPFQITFVAWNKGNTDLNVAFSAKETNGFKVTVAPSSARLEAGARLMVQAAVEAPVDLGKQVTALIQLAAVGDDQETKASASAKVDVVPRAIPGGDARWRLPLRLEMGGDTSASRPSWRITGGGALSEDDPGALRLDLSDTIQFAGYTRENFGLTLGEQGFNLSPLTEWGGSASGLALQGWQGDWSWMLTWHGGDRERAGLSVDYHLNPGACLSLIYLAQPELPSALWSLRGRFQPWPAAGLDLEYGRESEREAFRLAGDFTIDTLDVSAAWRHTPAGFRGEEHETTAVDLDGTTDFPGGYAVVFRLKDLDESSQAGLEAGRLRGFQLGLQRLWMGNRWAVLYVERDTVDASAQYDLHDRVLYLLMDLMLPRGSRLYQRLKLARTGDESVQTEANSVSYFLSHKRTLPHGSLVIYSEIYQPLSENAKTRSSLGLNVTWGWGRFHISSNLVISDPAARAGELATAVSYNWRTGYTLRMQIKGGWSAATAVQPEVEVRYSMPLNLSLGRRSSIARLTGRVVDGEGKGVPGVVLELASFSVVTGADGRFDFPAVNPGIYHVMARMDSLPPDLLPVPALPWRVELNPGEQRTQDFVLYRAAAVRGKVKIVSLDQAGPDSGVVVAGEGFFRPRPDLVRLVAIELVCGEERYQCSPDEEGGFAFEQLKPGKWQLVVHRNGLAEVYDIRPSELSLELSEGRELPIEIAIVPVLREVRFIEGGEVPTSD